MKSFFALISVLFLSTLVFAQEPKITIPYTSLLNETYKLPVTNVWGKILPTPVDPRRNIQTVQLLITVANACGDQILVQPKLDQNKLYAVSFAQINNQEGQFKQCSQVIEYYWEPKNIDVEVGGSTTVGLFITPLQEGVELITRENSIFVSMKVTRHFGNFPNGQAFGNYYTYSDLKVEKPVVNNIQ